MDLISKKAAVSRISGLLMLELKGERLPTWNEVYNAIGDLPAVDAAPVKHGRWEHSPTGYPFCSNCKWCPEEDDMTHGRYKYCPNCSALMENGDEYF